jgi:hypothetical protein
MFIFTLHVQKWNLLTNIHTTELSIFCCILINLAEPHHTTYSTSLKWVASSVSRLHNRSVRSWVTPKPGLDENSGRSVHSQSGSESWYVTRAHWSRQRKVSEIEVTLPASFRLSARRSTGWDYFLVFLTAYSPILAQWLTISQCKLLYTTIASFDSTSVLNEHNWSVTCFYISMYWTFVSNFTSASQCTQTLS